MEMIKQKILGIQRKLAKAKAQEGISLEQMKLIEAIDGIIEIVEYNDERISLLQNKMDR